MKQYQLTLSYEKLRNWLCFSPPTPTHTFSPSLTIFIIFCEFHSVHYSSISTALTSFIFKNYNILLICYKQNPHFIYLMFLNIVSVFTISLFIYLYEFVHLNNSFVWLDFKTIFQGWTSLQFLNFWDYFSITSIWEQQQLGWL